MERIREYVKERLKNIEGGHDYYHTLRVTSTALELSKEITCNSKIVEASALLHEINDPKFFTDIAPNSFIHELLKEAGLLADEISKTIEVLSKVSFRNSLEKMDISIPELNIVRDADFLDAIGAIGIARTFNYGGYKGSPLFDPETNPETHLTKESYIHNSSSPTLNHFYEKLFRIKNFIVTPKAREIAEKRHAYMIDFVNKFLEEWNGLS